MQSLNTEPNIDEPDEFFAELLAVHEDVSPSESEAVNSRLILILANHIGDRAVLTRALELAINPGA
jgi:hypothetical protein